jgi:hypothetical protein
MVVSSAAYLPQFEGFPTRAPLRRPAPAANRSCITICIRLKFMSNQPAPTEKISLLVNRGRNSMGSSGHDLSAEGTILMRQDISGRPRGIIFILTSQCKIRLLARAGRKGSNGGDLENLVSDDSSSTGTEPSISSRRRSIRAPSVAGRQAAPRGEACTRCSREVTMQLTHDRRTAGLLPAGFWCRPARHTPPGKEPSRRARR